MTGGTEHDIDPLDIPRCPIHSLTELELAGSASDGRDTRWVCPVPGCTITRIA